MSTTASRKCGARAYDDTLDLARLPVLTKRRVCIIADCSPWTVDRSPLKPIGKRGRERIYKTEDVLRWVRGELDAKPANDPPTIIRRSSTSSADAIARVRELARGGSK